MATCELTFSPRRTFHDCRTGSWTVDPVAWCSSSSPLAFSLTCGVPCSSGRWIKCLLSRCREMFVYTFHSKRQRYQMVTLYTVDLFTFHVSATTSQLNHGDRRAVQQDREWRCVQMIASDPCYRLTLLPAPFQISSPLHTSEKIRRHCSRFRIKSVNWARV